jgi:hypothetical protein
MASIIKVSEILHPTANVPSLTINSDSTVSFDAGILSVTGPINGVIGANTPYSGTFTSLNNSGNLTFTGAGQRITWNMSPAAIADRVFFQTSVTNGASDLNIMPNGTGFASNFTAFSSSDPANSSLMRVGVSTSTGVGFLNSFKLGTGAALPITFQVDGTEHMRIDASGNVGIGTSSPDAMLDIERETASGTGPAARFYRNQQTIENLRGLSIYGNQSGGFVDSTLVFGNTTNSYLAFGHHNGTSYSERMRIDSSGNVGIGTSSPTEKLDVSGNVKVSGSLSVAGNNISSQTGFKNRIINGDFRIWQRGTTRYSNSGMGASAKYYADRWTSGQFQNAAFERVDRTTAGPTSKYAMRVSSSSAAENGSGTRMTLGQLIEHLNCSELAEQSVTLSFWVRFSASSIANYGSFNYSIWQQDSVDLAFDTNGPTRSNTSSLTNGSFPTTWTKLTLVVTTASTMKNLAAQFGFTNLANTASNGSFWYEITEVQIEKNSVATPFEFRSIGTELALCQRYFQRLGNTAYAGIGTGFQQTTSISLFVAKQNVVMRASPSLGFSQLIVTDRTAFDSNALSIGGVATSPDSLYFSVTHDVAGVANKPVFLTVANGTTGYLDLLAEL